MKPAYLLMILLLANCSDKEPMIDYYCPTPSPHNPTKVEELKKQKKELKQRIIELEALVTKMERTRYIGIRAVAKEAEYIFSRLGNVKGKNLSLMTESLMLKGIMAEVKAEAVRTKTVKRWKETTQ